MISALILPVLLLTVGDLPQVDGKKLLAVPGPSVPHYPDAARGLVPKRDIQGSLRHQARAGGSIPAVALPKGPCVVLDTLDGIEGWKAYRTDVPARGKLKVRLRGDHEAWFAVRAMNKWGQLEKGMLQNRIPTGNPEASFINPKDQATQVFFVVDTTEMTASGEPYRLEISEQ